MRPNAATSRSTAIRERAASPRQKRTTPTAIGMKPKKIARTKPPRRSQSELPSGIATIRIPIRRKNEPTRMAGTDAMK